MSDLGSLTANKPFDALPDNNPKTRQGMAKPGTAAIPPVAVVELGRAMADGARKYGRFNWRDHEVTTSVYTDAIDRHMLAYRDGEDVAADSGVHHLAHVMACCAILIDAASVGKLQDDRRRDGTAASRILQYTQPNHVPVDNAVDKSVAAKSDSGKCP